jgi:HAD superfamily hydrolase (TIGR01490 family)
VLAGYRLTMALRSHPLPPAGPAAAPESAARAGHAAAGRSAAFFDLDNTLIQGASLFHLARGLAAHRFLTTRQIARFGWSQLAFRMRGERDGTVENTRSRALSFARGHTVAEMSLICQEIFDDYLATRIWPGTRALAQGHLGVGQPVWLVTAAPWELARVVADRLGLTGALGTTAEAVDGVYTGEIRGEVLHGPAKGAAVRELAEREGYRLAHCHAYSDSANDLPMLTTVGYPCAVNPDTRLRRHAGRNDWPVVDFRAGSRLLRGAPPGAGVAGTGTGTAAADRPGAPGPIRSRTRPRTAPSRGTDNGE